jgi:hypothetical protein
LKNLKTLLLLLILFSCEQRQLDNRSLFPIKEFDRFGFINVKGDLVIPARFDEVHKFSEGLAAFRVDSVWGFIDSTGKVMIEPMFINVESFSNGVCRVVIGGYKQAFVDIKGNIVFQPKNYTTNFSERLAQTKNDGSVAYIDLKGKVVIKTQYPYGDIFKEGIAKIWTSDSSRYIDIEGKIIFKLGGMGHSGFSEGLAAVRINGENVYVNKQGKVEINSLDKEWACFDFSEGLAKVTTPGVNHKSGFIDLSGKLVIPMKYSIVGSFSEGLTYFSEDDRWGFMNKKGEIVISPIYEDIDLNGFKGGLCRVKETGKWGYIDKMGKFIWIEKTD